MTNGNRKIAALIDLNGARSRRWGSRVSDYSIASARKHALLTQSQLWKV